MGSCLGELGPVDFSTIALLHGRDPLYQTAAALFTSTELQQLYIVLSCMNEALTQPRWVMVGARGSPQFGLLLAVRWCFSFG